MCVHTHTDNGISVIKKNAIGLPSGSVVKNLPTNAGDTDSIPVQEEPKFCGATKPMRPAPKPVLWSLCNYGTPQAQALRSATRAATAIRSPHTAGKSSPPHRNKKSPHNNKDLAQPKINKLFKLLKKKKARGKERLPTPSDSL